MKYQPLDLSFLKMRYSPIQNDIRATADAILARTNPYGQPDEVAFEEMAKAAKSAKKKWQSEHKISPISGFFDLLSTPLYGLANALDESIAGHQSDPNDSVLDDALKTAGGVFTGGAKGIGAGLRGGTAFLDAFLPGKGFDDTWQSDPTDKTTFKDVAIRLNTGMSTADAMKPENWNKVRDKLQKLDEKPWWNQSVSEWMIPDDLYSKDAREKYFRNNAIGGIVTDIGADPLNVATFGLGGAKSAIKSSKAIEEGLAAARASNETSPILRGLKLPIDEGKDIVSATPDVVVTDKGLELAHSGSFGYKEGGKAGTRLLEEEIPATGMKVNFPKLNYKPVGLKGVTPGSKAKEFDSVRGFAVNKASQDAVAKIVTKDILRGEKGWKYIAANKLAEMQGAKGIDFSRTLTYLENLDGAIKASGGAIKKSANFGNMVYRDLRSRIYEDLKTASTELSETRKATNLKTEVLPPELMKLKIAGIRKKFPVEFSWGTRPLTKKQDEILKKTIRHFFPQLLKSKVPAGIQDPEAYIRSIASGKTTMLNDAKQANVFNYVTKELGYRHPKKFDDAVRIIEEFENFFEKRNIIAHSHSNAAKAVPLKLSQVAYAIGPQILGQSHELVSAILRGEEKALATLTPEARQAIQAIKENEALASAAAAQKGIAAGQDLIDTVSKLPSSVARKKEMFNDVIKQAEKTSARFGGGEAGVRVTKEYLGNLLGKKDPVNFVINANRLKTEAWLAKAAKPMDVVNDMDFVKSVTNAISKAADLPTPAEMKGLTGAAMRVKDWLGARFLADYGVQNIRPILETRQASAMAIASERAKIINEKFGSRGFNFPGNPALAHEAMRVAQTNGIADGEVGKAAEQLLQLMENLFGGTGLRSGAISESTVVGRSRLYMDELNKNLRRFGLKKYQFTDSKKFKDSAGVVHDYSNGSDWLKSWEAWDIKDPYDFVHKVQTAVQHTVHEKVMFDDIIARFASPIKHGDVKYGVDHPRLRGYFFNEEGARQAKVFVQQLKDLADPSEKWLQHFDHTMSKIKAAMTIYIPGHHMTNLIGDVYVNWLASVNDPRRYEQALKLITTQRGRYGDFVSLNQLTSPEAVKWAAARSVVQDMPEMELKTLGIKDPAVSMPKGNSVLLTMKNGTKVTYDMLYTALFHEGVLPSARVLEDVASEVSNVLDKIHLPGKANGAVQRRIHQFAEFRDHLPRIAQGIDVVAKHGGSFDQAVKSAAAKIRKAHPDGLGLTNFERRGMKRFFPFYSWTRKAIPLAIEASFLAGPKVMAYPRAMEAVALANGIEPTSPSDQFPSDQLFPDWLRSRGIGPVAGERGNYLAINPSTPVLDMITLLGEPKKGALGMVNPLARVPFEVMQDREVSGAPINNYTDYAVKQVPVVSHLGRASGQIGVSNSAKQDPSTPMTSALNTILGAKVYRTGKYQKSAQFDIRNYLSGRRG